MQASHTGPRKQRPTDEPYGFTIGRHLVGDGYPCLLVGEVAQAHEGSLGMAHAFIDAIADAGADAVKFQTHIAAAESTVAEPFRIPSPQDASRRDYWHRMEFSPEQWGGLRRHAEDRALIFLSSPFSQEAVELLLQCGIQAWKVGSGEVTHRALLEAVAYTKLPVLISTGMTSWSDVGKAVDTVRAGGAAIAVLQCTSKYPTPPEEVGAHLMPKLREMFQCVPGLSDHSGTIYPSLVAAAFGAGIVEVHVTLSREMYGPDVAASVTTHELAQLVRGVRFVERMCSAVIDKDGLAHELSSMRAAFSRSIVARRSIRQGTVLTDADCAFKKPGNGLPPERLSDLIGRTVARDVDMDACFSLEDLDPQPTGARQERRRHEVDGVYAVTEANPVESES